jgi:hypothetical protein
MPHRKEHEVPTNSLPGLVLKIGKTAVLPELGGGAMSIIIQRPYARLKRELQRAFVREKEVDVIVDRRHGARRVSQQRVAVERRSAGRRSSKEQLLEVVLLG